jgi:hypothetical protein
MALQKTFLRLEQITALELQDRFAKFPTHLVHIGFHVPLNLTIRRIKAQKQLKPDIKTDDLQKKDTLSGSNVLFSQLSE